MLVDIQPVGTAARFVGASGARHITSCCRWGPRRANSGSAEAFVGEFDTSEREAKALAFGRTFLDRHAAFDIYLGRESTICDRVGIASLRGPTRVRAHWRGKGAGVFVDREANAATTSFSRSTGAFHVASTISLYAIVAKLVVTVAFRAPFSSGILEAFGVAESLAHGRGHRIGHELSTGEGTGSYIVRIASQRVPIGTSALTTDVTRGFRIERESIRERRISERGEESQSRQDHG